MASVSNDLFLRHDGHKDEFVHEAMCDHFMEILTALDNSLEYRSILREKSVILVVDCNSE